VARKNPTPAQKKRLLRRNKNRCCVCKRSGVGLHLHHLDGDNSNTIDENLAVLCVEDHDHYHRPSQYTKNIRHSELTEEELRQFKISWESFVEEAQKDAPNVLAVINVFGTDENIHSAKILFQWPDERVEFERTFHLLEGDFEYWTDEMLQEVQSIGENVRVSIIDEPLDVEYCSCGGGAFSHTLKEGVVVKHTDPDWAQHSIMSIYVNPEQPSLALTVSTPEKRLYSAGLHLCNRTHLHFMSDYFDETTKVKRKPSIRIQATQIVNKVIDAWEPAVVLIGTGDHDHPTIIKDLTLPSVWEDRVSWDLRSSIMDRLFKIIGFGGE